MSDSSTAGYLQPIVVTDINDADLDDFLQGLVAGITGLDGELVRPRYQEEPPTIPAFGITWAAVGEQRRTADLFALDFSSNREFQGLNDSKYRNEILEILCSFYGPKAQQYAEVLSIGFQVDQNREQMQLNGFAFIEASDFVRVPELIQNKWVNRIDVPFRLRRAQEYTFGVLDLVASDVTVKDDTDAIDQHFIVDQQSVASLPLFGFDMSQATYGGWDRGKWR